MALTALVLGGAATLAADEAAARALFAPDLIIATNHAGRDAPHVDHWASFHVELFPMWIAARETAGRPPAGQLWGPQRRVLPTADMPVRRVANWGGSSGLLAVTAALELGCRRIVLAGVPLDMHAAHYDDPQPWRDAGNYRRAWVRHLAKLGDVRSMSGWTRQLLGAPNAAWLKGN